MLLTLTASSLRSMLTASKGGKPRLALTDLPAYARDTLGLNGLNLSTDMLRGMRPEQIESLRERADRAGCACLLLIESSPQPLSDPGAAGDAAIERLARVAKAASLLGCNALAVSPSGPDDPTLIAPTALRLRKVIEVAEKLELSVLAAPTPGLLGTPERVTELLKKVGGFRVGTFPDFQAAAASADPSNYLRRLTPYASVVSATTLRWVSATAAATAAAVPAEKPAPKSRSKAGAAAAAAAAPGSDDGDYETPVRHEPYDLAPLVKALTSVGYDATLAVDYRGTGDATLGVLRSRRALEGLLQQAAGEE